MSSPKKIRVVVLFGGQSGEHEVSVASGKSVIAALNSEKYDVLPIAITKQGAWLSGKKAKQYLTLLTGAATEGGITEVQTSSLVTTGDTTTALEPLAEKLSEQHIDIVLPLIHGSFGEDGRLQGMLDMLGVPYVFSGMLASALAMDKPKAKLFAKQAGLQVLPEVVLTSSDVEVATIAAQVGLPAVVKPAELGSSVGIRIVHDEKELATAIRNAFVYGKKVMVEQFKAGRELTVGVFGNQPPRALAVIEIIPQGSEFYDYTAKYAAGGSKHVCPAQIPAAIEQLVKQDAVKVFGALECCDLARVDFIYNEKENAVYFLEINTIPGMTSTSLVPDEAREAGIDFTDFLNQLIQMALTRYSNAQKKA
ncbi:MAG: hypothetical protein A2840_02250 [Candidatus Buchananbacteria bacterium RIFCSPHIGHO2_01_FULL_47_11b]|uniref:D-alanine--D-alanine ligase n=1 Tax=Candidatus Buchananbacteria bacterium RIFCSPHIGHO2_01_FULL_47_11b TaxID=1797537 RepID=A0A1G1Y746_9BACT|nr:MAG: hypothetical protein A2840_02250 [Candidatus Buchananbacteria bacterium RIFCSPHIGHO2_01_FULL_47_11b]